MRRAPANSCNRTDRLRSAARPSPGRRRGVGLPLAACAAVGWLGLVLADSRAAGATPAAEQATVEDRETARAAYHLGVERFEAEDFHGALEAFEAADRIMRVPTTGLELARTRAMLGLLLEARERLLEVGRQPVAQDEPPPFVQARREAARLAEDVAARIPSVRLEITGPGGPLPVGATPEIHIDGRALAADLLKVPRRLNPGPHTVEVGAAGFAPQRQTLVLTEREQRVVQFVLTRLRAGGGSARPGQGSGDGPPPVADGGEEPAAARADGGLSPLVPVGFALGGAGLLVGAITGAVTLADASSLADVCPDQRCSPEQEANLDRARALGHTSTVGFIVGGVGVALGVLGLVLSDWNDGGSAKAADASAPRLRLGLAVGPRSVGLGGAF